MKPTVCSVLVSVWLLKLSLVNTIKTDYCKIEPKRHFLCENDEKSGRGCDPNSISYPRNILDKTHVLNALNDIRAKVANGKLLIGNPKFTPPQAANMYELKWDDECEKAASNIIKYCEANSDFYSNLSNIFARFEAGLFLDLGYYSIRDNITTMADPLLKKIYTDDNSNFQDISLESGKITRKYTSTFYATKLSILIKAEVSVVGCSMIIQDLGEGNIDCILACVFGGIATWEEPLLYLYETGVPCSQCPVVSQCSSTNPGLCACKERCFSYSKDVKKSGFYDSYAIVVDKETSKDEIIPLGELDKESYQSTYRYIHSTPSTTSTPTSIAIESPMPNSSTDMEFPKITKLPTIVESIATELSSTPLRTSIESLTTAEHQGPEKTAEPQIITESQKTTEHQGPEKTAEPQTISESQKTTEVAIKRATIQALSIDNADYEVDYQQNFEQVAMVTTVRSATKGTTMPSAYTSSGSSRYITYGIALTMFATETVVLTSLHRT